MYCFPGRNQSEHRWGASTLPAPENSVGVRTDGNVKERHDSSGIVPANTNLGNYSYVPFFVLSPRKYCGNRSYCSWNFLETLVEAKNKTRLSQAWHRTVSRRKIRMVDGRERSYDNQSQLCTCRCSSTCKTNMPHFYVLNPSRKSAKYCTAKSLIVESGQQFCD